MAALDYYLQRKNQILAQRRADWEPARETGVVRLSASSKLAWSLTVKGKQLSFRSLGIEKDDAGAINAHLLSNEFQDKLSNLRRRLNLEIGLIDAV